MGIEPVQNGLVFFHYRVGGQSPTRSQHCCQHNQNLAHPHSPYFSVNWSCGTSMTSTRLGAVPTLTRAISFSAFTSKMEVSSVSALLTPAYLPSAEKLIQLGQPPTVIFLPSFLLAMS